MSAFGFVERLVRGAQVGGTVLQPAADGSWPVRSQAGEPVTVDKALGLPAAFRAIRLFSESGGALPLQVYRRVDGGRERARSHPAYALLHDRPNDHLTAVEFWTMALAHLAGWGRLLIGKERAGSRVVALHPIHPRDVTIERLESGRLVFREQRREPPAREVVWPQEDLLYIRLFTLDGVTGLSPIALQRETMGLGLAMRKHASRFFRDSAIPSGALTVEDEIKDPDVRERLREEWDARHRGNRGTAILDNGAKFAPVSMPYKDVQFIELAGLTRLDVADAFNMPASLLGAPTGDSLTYGNRESDMQQFLTFTLHNPLKKIEQALSSDRDLFPQVNTHYCEFLRDELLRPDSKARSAFYRLALDPERGWMRREEVRRLENLPAEDDELEQLLSSENGNGSEALAAGIGRS